MQLIEGTLTRLGDSRIDSKRDVVKYSLVQMGGLTLTGLVIDRGLNHFLNDGLGTPARTRLWLLDGGKTVMAVKVGNAPRYYGRLSALFYVGAGLNLGLAVALLPMSPVGGAAWALLAGWLFGRRWRSYRRIAAVGGVKV